MGERYQLKVNVSDTIKDVKSRIQWINGAHPDQQILIFAEKQLQDSSTLSDCSTFNESTLHFLLRLRGQ